MKSKVSKPTPFFVPAKPGDEVEVLNSPYSHIFPGMVGLCNRSDTRGIHAFFKGVIHPMKASSVHCKEFNDPIDVTVWLAHGTDYKIYVKPKSEQAPVQAGPESQRSDASDSGFD